MTVGAGLARLLVPQGRRFLSSLTSTSRNVGLLYDAFLAESSGGEKKLGYRRLQTFPTSVRAS